MRSVSDDFLLTVASLAAGLVGLFLVGVFFFIQTGFRRVTHDRGVVERYFKSGTRIVLVLFAIPIFLSLTLVALDLVWSRVLFVVLSLVLVAANLDSAIRIRPIARSSAGRTRRDSSTSNPRQDEQTPAESKLNSGSSAVSMTQRVHQRRLIAVTRTEAGEVRAERRAADPIHTGRVGRRRRTVTSCDRGVRALSGNATQRLTRRSLRHL